MIVPKSIEASNPTAVFSSVSLSGLQSVGSCASFASFASHASFGSSFGRFQHDSQTSTDKSIVQPTRKRSMDALTLLSYYDDESSKHNATFDDDRSCELKPAAKTARLENAVLSSDDLQASAASFRPPSGRAPTQDHLMERFLKMVDDAKHKQATAPQMPKRKASIAQVLSSANMPLSMPVRKASNFDLATSTHRRRSC